MEKSVPKRAWKRTPNMAFYFGESCLLGFPKWSKVYGDCLWALIRRCESTENQARNHISTRMPPSGHRRRRAAFISDIPRPPRRSQLHSPARLGRAGRRPAAFKRLISDCPPPPSKPELTSYCPRRAGGGSATEFNQTMHPKILAHGCLRDFFFTTT
jgi:hypothetical protein